MCIIVSMYAEFGQYDFIPISHVMILFFIIYSEYDFMPSIPHVNAFFFCQRNFYMYEYIRATLMKAGVCIFWYIQLLSNRSCLCLKFELNAALSRKCVIQPPLIVITKRFNRN